MIVRTLFLSLMLAAVNILPAQEHPFLSKFQLAEGDGWVSIDWTMVAGGTCDGTQILRSLDSTHFEAVGMISGICGDISNPVDYRYVDHSIPELRTLYYRLDLGGNGYSSIKRIELQRLNSAEHLFRPSPVDDHGQLLLRTDLDVPVEIHFFDQRGATVHSITGRGGSHPIDVGHWPAGMYLYQAISEGSRLSGKFVVE